MEQFVVTSQAQPSSTPPGLEEAWADPSQSLWWEHNPATDMVLIWAFLSLEP